MVNVPEIRVEFDPLGSPSTAAPEWRDLSEYARLTDGISWSSGRQDETASIQAGVMSVSLNNDGGIFTPGSGEASTRWGTDLRIRVPIRLRARYGGGAVAYGDGLYGSGSYSPTIAGNLLSAESASFEGGTVGGWVAGGTVAPALSVSTAHPYTGAKGLLITWGTGGTLPLAQVTVTGLVIGRYYTATAYVWVPTGSPDPALVIGGSTIGASTAVKDTHDRISVTWQASASSTSVQVWPASSPTSGQTCYVDAVQVDEGTTVGDFTTATPPVYDVWSGFVDSWDNGWVGGRRPATQVRASDRVARLSRKTLRSMLQATILADDPAFYYPLTEDAGTSGAGDVSGAASAATLVSTQIGTGGTLAFGSGTGPAAESTSAVLFTPASSTQGKYLVGISSAPTTWAALTLEAWVTTTSTTLSTIASWGAGSGGETELRVTAAGKVAAYVGGLLVVTSASSINDGSPHHVAVTVTVSTATLYLDGVSAGTGTPYPSYSYSRVEVGGYNVFSTNLFTGSVSHVAGYTSALTGAQITAHYDAGSDGFAAETSDARFDRICAATGLPAALYSSPETGLTTMGAQDIANRSAWASITDVADAERGVAFSAASGVITFHGRSHRYNTASAFTLLGSDAAPGLVFTTDDQTLINDATVTRPGGAARRVVNADSVTRFDTYDTSLTVYADSDAFVENLAQYLVNAYGVPAARCSAVEVDLYSKAATAPVASILAAGIGTRFTLDDLPDSSSAPAPAVDLFIEGISGTVNDREYRWRANTSPVATSAVWQLDSATYSQLDSTTTLAF